MILVIHYYLFLNNKEYGDILLKIESITKEKCDEYLTDKYKLVLLDPEKICPISIIDESNKFYKYSVSRRKRNYYLITSDRI